MLRGAVSLLINGTVFDGLFILRGIRICGLTLHIASQSILERLSFILWNEFICHLTDGNHCPRNFELGCREVS